MMASQLVVCFFTLTLGFTTVNGLSCYKCDTQKSTLCGYGLTSFTYDTEECPSAGPLDIIIGPKCFKINAQDKKGNGYIARGCLPPGTVGCSSIATAIGWIGSQINDPDGLSNLSCDTCETDKCNSAPKMAGATIIALVISAVLFMF